MMFTELALEDAGELLGVAVDDDAALLLVGASAELAARLDGALLDGALEAATLAGALLSATDEAALLEAGVDDFDPPLPPPPQPVNAIEKVRILPRIKGDLVCVSRFMFPSTG